jgi:membrane fusion protein, multidrug efflux system
VQTIRSGAAQYGRVVLVIVAVAAAVGGGIYWWMSRDGGAVRTARSSTRPPVPVSVAVAARRDLPIHLTGLGTVQASFTVRVNPQVDGRLQEVLFAEGQRVKKGDVLARIDPRLYRATLDQARAKKAQDEALLVAAEKDLVRAEALLSRSFGTEQNLDQQRAKVAQLKASIAADEAAIETAQTQLDYTVITAPNDGRVGMRLVDPGNLIRASDANPIATLILLQPTAVVFTVPSRMLPEVRAAMAHGPVEVVAFDQTNRRPIATGTLLLIDNAIDQATSTGRLKAMFPNEDESLWPGDFVNARVLLKTESKVVAVPSSAVQRGPQGLFAWIVTDKSTAEPRPIEVGPTSGDMTIIMTGLKEGERVVTDGHYKLFRNATVTVGAPKSAEAGLAK